MRAYVPPPPGSFRPDATPPGRDHNASPSARRAGSRSATSQPVLLAGTSMPCGSSPRVAAPSKAASIRRNRPAARRFLREATNPTTEEVAESQCVSAQTLPACVSISDIRLNPVQITRTDQSKFIGVERNFSEIEEKGRCSISCRSPWSGDGASSGRHPSKVSSVP